MQVYLAVSPGQVRDASRYTRSFAHVAYRIGTDSTLLRQNLLIQSQGGLLALSDREAPEVGAPERLTAALMRECSRRGYGGVVLDFEEPPRGDLQMMVSLLARQRGRLALYVPEQYASAAPSAAVLIGTAISGGDFQQYLRDAAERLGPGRLALDLERLTMDFPLPCPKGQGRPMSREEFDQLMRRESPPVFFSQSLCARYFTYSQEGSHHFILFDDADTLSQKLRIGRELGATAVLMQYPEVSDLLGQLFRH